MSSIGLYGYTLTLITTEVCDAAEALFQQIFHIDSPVFHVIEHRTLFK